MSGKLAVGTSGYSYPHWSTGLFYPQGLPQKRWLEYYARKFNTVELNVTFYRLPKQDIFNNWRRRTPKDFIFSVKGSRYITHLKHLKECERSTVKFFNECEGLGDKLDVVLWQLPPNMRQNSQRLDDFCLKLKAGTGSSKIRQAFEFRHSSWLSAETVEIMKNNGYAICVADSNKWPLFKDVTSDFLYLRFHGGKILYGSNYSEQELSSWARWVSGYLRQGYDVYAYFNNDSMGYALDNAKNFYELVHNAA